MDSPFCSEVELWTTMCLRRVAMAAVISFITWQGITAQAGETNMNPVQAQTDPQKRTHAEANVTVRSSKAKPYEQTASPVLMEIEISETFAGDLDGESTVRSLEVQRHDKSASMVSLQRFVGKLGGRQGTFVLQGSEYIENGRITAKWFVVPGSGTGELLGLRGEGGFEGDFGKGSRGTLDYWFE